MTQQQPRECGPQFEFNGLRFHVSRKGDCVTGRVTFPNRTSIGDHCVIHYLRTDPLAEDGSTASPKAVMRLEAVQRYQTLVESAKGRTPKLTKRNLLDMVVASYKKAFSPRSLQIWIRKYELEGAAGLEDRYTPAPTQALECAADQAKDALLVCAWWAFRIGNVTSLDTSMMHSALALVKGKTPGGRPWSTADLLAIIDCYYSWPCDRNRFRFKPFARWARHDIDTWALRAAEHNDYRRAAYEARKEQVPLRDPIIRGTGFQPVGPPSPKQRSRETSDRRTRRAILKLDSGAGVPARQSTCTPNRFPLVGDAKPTLGFARTLGRLGFTDAARSITAGMVTTGPVPIAENEQPQTLAESLGLLEDRWRLMLIRASRGDREELDAAVATISQWWDAMPKALRSNIDARSHAWRKDHPVSDQAANRRRVQQMLNHLRERPGTNRLAVAARIPT